MPQKTLPVRGRHITVRVTQDSKPVKVYTFTDLTAREDAEITASSYLGEPTKISSRDHNGWEIEAGGELAGREVHDLEDAIISRDKNRQSPVVINLNETIYFRNGVTASWTYMQCALKIEHSAGSREGFVKFKLTGRSDIRIAG